MRKRKAEVVDGAAEPSGSEANWPAADGSGWCGLPMLPSEVADLLDAGRRVKLELDASPGKIRAADLADPDPLLPLTLPEFPLPPSLTPLFPVYVFPHAELAPEGTPEERRAIFALLHHHLSVSELSSLVLLFYVPRERVWVDLSFTQSILDECKSCFDGTRSRNWLSLLYQGDDWGGPEVILSNNLWTDSATTRSGFATRPADSDIHSAISYRPCCSSLVRRITLHHDQHEKGELPHFDDGAGAYTHRKWQVHWEESATKRVSCDCSYFSYFPTRVLAHMVLDLFMVASQKTTQNLGQPELSIRYFDRSTSTLHLDVVFKPGLVRRCIRLVAA